MGHCCSRPRPKDHSEPENHSVVAQSQQEGTPKSPCATPLSVEQAKYFRSASVRPERLWGFAVAGPTTLDDPRAANAVRRPDPTGRVLSPTSSVLSERPAPTLPAVTPHTGSLQGVVLLWNSCNR